VGNREWRIGKYEERNVTTISHFRLQASSFGLRPCARFVHSLLPRLPIPIGRDVQNPGSVFVPSCCTDWRAFGLRPSALRIVGATSIVWTGVVKGRQSRVREQHHHVGVVMRETAVLGQLLAAARVGDADVRSDDNIRRARVVACARSRRVVELRDPRSPENLADTGDIAG